MSRKLIFLLLVTSSPALGKETYACFETGVNDPEPRKLTIDGSFVVGPSMLGEVEVHSEDDFCSLSKISLQHSDGIVSVSCFNRRDLKIFQSFTLLGGFKNDDDDSSETQNITWRCISTD
jgi:hypothetical protein